MANEYHRGMAEITSNVREFGLDPDFIASMIRSLEARQIEGWPGWSPADVSYGQGALAGYRKALTSYVAPSVAPTRKRQTPIGIPAPRALVIGGAAVLLVLFVVWLARRRSRDA
jgi:hypothetical protein